MMHGKANQSRLFFSQNIADLSNINPLSDRPEGKPLRKTEQKSLHTRELSLPGLLMMTAPGACALVLVTCLVLVGVSACEAPAEITTAAITDLQGSFERGVLVVEADDGTQLEFDIYLAVTFEQKQRGLMFVRNLPERTGMLFIYDEDGIRSMWMKNTYISLDLVFIRSDGTVASVIRDAQPLSLQSLSSAEPVRFVLELNAGVSRRYGIGRGSSISWGRASDRL